MESHTVRPLPPLVSHSITIVIPCLNEEGNLEKLFLDLQLTFDNIGFTLPVLLIDDGSVDQTPPNLSIFTEEVLLLKGDSPPPKTRCCSCVAYRPHPHQHRLDFLGSSRSRIRF